MAGCCGEEAEPQLCVIELPDFKDIIPEEGYHKEIAELANVNEGEPLPFRKCSGRALLTVRRLTLFAFCFNLALLILCCRTSVCDEKLKYAKVDERIWLLIFPVGILRVWAERDIHKWVTIPYVQIRGQFGPPNIRCHYNLWILFMHTITVAQLVDNFSDVLFTARTFESEQCNDGLMSRLFKEVMAHSFMLNHVTWDFGVVVMVCFGVMLMQYAMPVIESVPIVGEWNAVDYDVQREGRDMRFDYTNMACESTNTGDALCSLAEGAGLGTLLQIGLLYPQAKEQWARQRAEAKGEFKPEVSLPYLKNGLIRGLSRVGHVAILENALQLNLQITVLALKMATTMGHHKRSVTSGEIFSVFMSGGMAALKFNECMMLLRFSWNVRQAIDKSLASTGVERTRGLFFSTAYSNLSPEAREMYRGVMYRTYAIRLCAILLGFFTFYGIAKFWFMFHCKYAVWNITGCVDLAPLLQKIGHHTGRL